MVECNFFLFRDVDRALSFSLLFVEILFTLRDVDALSPDRQLTTLEVEAGCFVLLSDGWAGNDGWNVLASLVEKVAVVVIAAVFERHDVGEQVAIGENDFHWSWLTGGRTYPLPYLASIGSISHVSAESTFLVAMQVGGIVVGCANLAVDGFVPAETR